MREIKFRGYNETFGWRYGDYKFTRLDDKKLFGRNDVI